MTNNYGIMGLLANNVTKLGSSDKLGAYVIMLQNLCFSKDEFFKNISIPACLASGIDHGIEIWPTYSIYYVWRSANFLLLVNSRFSASAVI